MPLGEAIANQIISLKQHTSKSNNEIGLDLGISHQTVGNIWRRFTLKESVKPYLGATMGRKSKLTTREKTLIIRESKKNQKPHQMKSEPCVEKLVRKCVHELYVGFMYRWIKGLSTCGETIIDFHAQEKTYGMGKTYGMEQSK
jgi:hypothetical protein